MISTESEHTTPYDNLRQENIFSSDPTEIAELEQAKTERKSKKSLRSSKKISIQSSPRPKSSKTSMVSIRTKDDINTLGRETSQQVIRSVYSLISSKFPLTYGKNELSQRDQEEIQDFFLRKKCEFNKILEEISVFTQSSCKKPTKNPSVQSNKLEQKYLNEIMMIHKKQKELKKEIMQKANEKIIKEKKKQKKQQELEKKKKIREEKLVQGFEKQLIISNIDNFYKDRIVIVKDRFQREVENKKIVDYDEKKYMSELAKEHRRCRQQEIDHLKMKYDVKIEELKDKYNSL
jgi:hypothetical protein